jgi:putative transcriptional regulator
MRNHLEKLRKERELSQEDLAGQLGVSRQTVISIEQGRYNPSLPLALKIADHFGIVDLREIFYEPDTDRASVNGAGV